MTSLRTGLIPLLLLSLTSTGCGLRYALAPIDPPPALPPAVIESLAAERGERVSDKPRALLLVGTEGTEVYDLLAPFEVLSASGVFEVATVAPVREPQPLTGRIAILPDYAFDAAPRADLIVVPAVANPEDPQLVRFLQERGPQARVVLSVCEGARLVARAGLLDGRRAATHFFAVSSLDDAHPNVDFVHGYRFVWDEPVLSSAGVSAALDASLFAVSVFAGESAARATERRLGAEWVRGQDASGERALGPRHHIGARDVLRLLAAYLRPGKQRAGVWLREGVSEIALAATLDALPRSLRLTVEPVADTLQPLRTRHGLTLVPAATWGDVGTVDLVVVPGPDRATPLPAGADAPVVEVGSPLPGRALLETLDFLAAHVGPAHARTVATMLELPPEQIGALASSRRSEGAATR